MENEHKYQSGEIRCDQCNLPWSTDPEDYPWLRNEDYIVCSCGNPLFQKQDLLDLPHPVIQPAEY